MKIRRFNSQPPTSQIKEKTFQKKITKPFSRSAPKKETNLERKEGGSFINKYLNGELLKQHPDIVFGKTCYDMPIKEIEILEPKISAAYTGPDGGLLSINISTKPFELADDVDFIDEDYPDSSLSSIGFDTTSSPNSSTKLFKSSSSFSSSRTSASPTMVITPKKTTSSNMKISDDRKESIVSRDSNSKEPIAGIDDWNCPNENAYGISTTLYESNPTTRQKAGDPIADSFAICLRENSAIIALADGVNWGEKACLASRCAVYGCIDYLNKALYSRAESTRSRNTMDIFVALLRSFDAAHHTILSQGGYLTTLCAAVICQLKNSDRFIVCTCNVGDSLAYVYSETYGVREITQGSEPELNNLTVAMTIVDVGDIVFLTSDGISDNFDPVVGKFAIAKKDIDHDSPVACMNGQLEPCDPTKNDYCTKLPPKKSRKVRRSNSNPEKSLVFKLQNYSSKGLPMVSAQQRHELSLLRMEDLIKNGVNQTESSEENSEDYRNNNHSNGNYKNNHSKTQSNMTAKELCSLMVDFSTKLTMAKRRILEDPELYVDDEEMNDSSIEAFDRQRRRRRLVGSKLAQFPGKLDHASIAAVKVGFYGQTKTKRSHHLNRTKSEQTQNETTSSSSSTDESKKSLYNLKMTATLARFESQDSLESINESGPI
ncbi:PP2C-like protein domain-containing protein CG9801-like protein [Sarcoptes scabiei]|uniref:PP2C-like protein domain-containing protein CG9801-like protein n=1 Tax=Sarcoptes scabiei TaxID=52283 RepID=A0A131ZSS5_SARSC|nr:PP2C-like protein domain-containing protein CG9801-like protein [Sarcoptes scabiei]